MKFYNILRNSSRRSDFYPGEKYRCFKRVLDFFTKRKGTLYFAKKIEHIAKKYATDDCVNVGAKDKIDHSDVQELEIENFE